ncbi:MAG: PorV/PorQ family protein [Candidatus Eisenbacteria bacterium]|nr:PorV/PorQ family protein [Candidatus Eisenbacteria bacterium]
MKRTALVLAALIVIAAGTAHAEDGTTGLAFLKLGVGARAIGMGDAHAAVGGDASSIYWNPAGSVSVENIDVLLMHSEWFEGIRYEYAGAVKSDGRQAFGLGVVGLYVNDLERREGPTSEPLGDFGVFDMALTGTYARRLTDDLDVGASAKYLHSEIDDESASGIAFDAGAQYRLPALSGLALGVSVHNLGAQMKYVEDEFDLPVLGRVGAAYSTPVEALNGTVLVVADAVIPVDGDTKLHAGIEYEYNDLIALRAGYRSGWDNQNISAGFGAKVRNFRVDYAYVPFYSDLGDTHRISLGFAL